MAKFFPDDHGEVACIKCLRVDSVARKGRNELIAVTPQDGFTLYIHHDELLPMHHVDFEALYSCRVVQALKGKDAQEVPAA